jgi:hypothetical protein
MADLRAKRVSKQRQRQGYRLEDLECLRDRRFRRMPRLRVHNERTALDFVNDSVVSYTSLAQIERLIGVPRLAVDAAVTRFQDEGMVAGGVTIAGLPGTWMVWKDRRRGGTAEAGSAP